MTIDANPIVESAEIIGSRYRILQPLGTGGMGRVYRAFDRLTEQYVALKKIAVNSPPDTDKTISLEVIDLQLALAHEFQALSGLRHPNIVTVLDYGFTAKQPFLVMELIEQSQTITEAALKQSFDTRLKLLVQILHALAYLHRHDITHRDLKPSNILVTNDQVKLLDFGLASMSAGDLTTAGTLAYMAPEVLRGARASTVTDLYTIGVIMYEMFTGRHPVGTFTSPFTISHLVDTILTTVPDFSEVDQRIAPIVARLLEKEPEKRFDSTLSVMNALNAVSELPLLIETVTTRESFLQAARFVGREHELATLTEALTKPLTDAGSGVWLIGGESGVGKSRLLDEVRTRALVRGRSVMRGQAISEGSSVYQLWRDILRWLCLRVELSTLEASILKTVIPDIGRLLDREIPDAPALELNAMQERFLGVFIALFMRQLEPVLVILEDLHWAGSEDLLLLRRVLSQPPAPISPAEPLVIIMASYRDDESPRLPEDLPGAIIMTLPRLADADIAQLSESMLGSAGRQVDVINLLQHETEGNVFFLIEVVRVLAEEAGTLENIGRQTLPQHVFSGGVQQIIRRRLSRIPVEARPLLRLAAIAGRQLDLDLIQLLVPDQDLPRWLSACADVAVLDIIGQRWRFSHDKLRETLLAELDADDLCGLNERVAEALEALHGQDPQYAAALAYHWSQAKNADRKAYYMRVAGQHALVNNAYLEAITFFKEYTDWSEQNPASAASPGDALQWANVEQQMAMAYYSLAELSNAHEHLQRAMRQLAWPIPTNRLAIYRGAAYQALLQFVTPVRWLKGRLSRLQTRPILQLTANIDATLSQIEYINGQMPAAAYHTFHLANVAEQAHTLPELAIGYANLTLALGQFRLHRLAHHYAALSQRIAQVCGQPAAAAYALTITATYHIGVGDWDEVRQALDEALQITQQSGERRRAHEILANYSFMLGLRGKFDASFELRVKMLDSAIHGGDLQARGWALSGMGEMRLWRNDLVGATAYLQARLALNQEFTSDVDQTTTSHALLALAYWRSGNLPAMRTAIDNALSQLTVVGLQAHYFQRFASLSEVLLDLLEARVAPGRGQRVDTALLPSTDEITAYVQTVLFHLTAFARIYPIGRPWLMRNQGTATWLTGDVKRAHKLWARALVSAIELKMPFDEACTRYEIGRHLLATDPGRRDQLDKAMALFAELGATYNLSQTQEACEPL